MEFRIYLRMLQQGWWLIALSALTALSLSLVSLYQDTPRYRTSARFIVSPTTSITFERDIIYSLDTLDQRSIISTYAEVLNSDRMYHDVAAALQLGAEEIANYHVSAVVLPEANILELSVEGPDPYTAALLANGVGQRAIDYIQLIYRKVYDINFLDPAQIPSDPFSPQPARDISLATALGLMFGVALAVVREYVSTPLEALQRMNMVDSESKAYTRRFFERRLEKELAKSGTPDISIGLVQLNGLHDIIDNMPQPIVQRLMRRVIEILRDQLRGSDIVARWEPLSFAIMLPSTPIQPASQTLDRIRRGLAEPLLLDKSGGQIIMLDPYVGVAEAFKGEPANMFVRRAEEALQVARLKGTRSALFSGNGEMNGRPGTPPQTDLPEYETYIRGGPS